MNIHILVIVWDPTINDNDHDDDDDDDDEHEHAGIESKMRKWTVDLGEKQILNRDFQSIVSDCWLGVTVMIMMEMIGFQKMKIFDLAES